MSQMQIPERLIAFNAYNGADILMGVVDVELPEISFMKDTISGAGIGGEYESAVVGHTESMKMTVNFRTQTKAARDFLKFQAHDITLRGAQQLLDKSTGRIIVQPIRIVARTLPSNVSLGTLAPSASTDTSAEVEVTYIKMDVDGEKVLEIDKLNAKYEIDGVDFYADVRQALGI